MSKKRIALPLCTVLLLLPLFLTVPAEAQGKDSGWSEPYQLSTGAGKASEASLVADQYGYVHAFWTETLFENQHTVIEYARFDGGTWSAPNDIYITPQEIENISSVVDKQGVLHIVWTEGLKGPAFYMHAPASNALSAQNWTRPVRIDIPAGIIQFQIDTKGVFHIIYIDRMTQLGVYYVRSKDRGQTWSEPVWLDPKIPSDYTPQDLTFKLDSSDGLHVVWNYGILRDDIPSTASVRYSHSLDGGDTWSVPFIVDRYGGNNEYGAGSGPRMIVQGQTVQVVWAGGERLHRFYRYSTDAGQTWSPSKSIFGDLEGQAWDGLAVDGAGRIHFFGQIRYPMGIYHAYWDQTRWSKPSLVYLISEDGGDLGDRIHAHLIQAAVRTGNQIVLTFGDPPADDQRRLFVMYRTLDDVAPLKTLPTPIPAATMTMPPSPIPTQMGPTAVATASLLGTAISQRLEAAPRADRALQFGIVPVLLLLGCTLVFRLWYKPKS